MTSRPVVLNTRPREQAAQLTQLLTEAGFEPVEAPAIAIVSGWDDAELESVRSDLEAGVFDWVVLASANAAHRLEAHLSSAQVVCGLATAEALDLKADIALQRFSAAAALQALRPRLEIGQRVLVPRAAEGRDELIDGLHALGIDVDAPVAYRTIDVDDAALRLSQGGIDIVTVCSPSAARAISGSVPQGIPVVCIGETTASAARSYGLHVLGVATTTSMPSLVAAVELVAASRV